VTLSNQRNASVESEHLCATPINVTVLCTYICEREYNDDEAAFLIKRVDFIGLGHSRYAIEAYEEGLPKCGQISGELPNSKNTRPVRRPKSIKPNYLTFVVIWHRVVHVRI
jgi:hypothetical protein